jgi:hypothetical protein
VSGTRLNRAQALHLNKNPSNSNKSRTAHSSTCTGSRSTPRNSLDRTAPDVPPRAPFPPVSPRFDLRRPVLARSRSSAQHTATRPRAQVGNRLPLHVASLTPYPLYFPNRFASIFLSPFTNLSCFHRHFCARMPLHLRAVPSGCGATLGLPPGGSRCIGPIPVPWRILVRSWM